MKECSLFIFSAGSNPSATSNLSFPKRSKRKWTGPVKKCCWTWATAALAKLAVATSNVMLVFGIELDRKRHIFFTANLELPGTPNQRTGNLGVRRSERSRYPAGTSHRRLQEVRGVVGELADIERDEGSKTRPQEVPPDQCSVSFCWPRTTTEHLASRYSEMKKYCQ